jgi:hypothetical protein
MNRVPRLEQFTAQHLISELYELRYLVHAWGSVWCLLVTVSSEV